MPRPIRIITLTTGAALLVCSLISISIFWPRIAALDWRFFKALLVVGIPLAYVLVSIITEHSPCYWLAVLLLKLETFQWLVIECCGRFIATYKEMYPIREQQVRVAVSGSRIVEAPKALELVEGN